MNEVNFPAHYKPLPKGYRVVWDDDLEHYYWINDKDETGLSSWDRFWCRRCAFAHKKGRIN